MKEDFVFFWGNSSPFSNWYKSPFVYQETEFNCSEQFMMLAKAKLFGDEETGRKIMATKNPREQKSLGRTVRDFEQEWWLLNCIDIMVPALVEKFTQDKYCYEAMEATLGKTIVESSPVDAVWGIGLHESDPRAWDKSTWQGKNLLGVTLEKARSIIFTT